MRSASRIVQDVAWRRCLVIKTLVLRRGAARARLLHVLPWTACLLFALAVPASGEQVIRIGEGLVSEATLFPFDSGGIPWRHGVQLALVRAARDAKPVLTLGAPGSPDSGRISYYGTVIRVGDELRMWYLGHPAEDPDSIRLCYAVSTDGRHWEKPRLGLVDYGGSRANNLVDLQAPGDLMSCNVLYEPDDPDPARRYKLFYELRPEYRGHVAFSPDGWRWRASSRNPVTHIRIEPSGLIKRDGCYYICAQNANIDRGFQKRVLITLASYDFEHWTEASCLGFRRDAVPPRSVHPPFNAGPQVHLGASLWDRENVVLGFYGMWNMPVDDMDRRRLRMDLGLLVTHDALTYTEPIPDFKIVDGFEEGWTAENPDGEPGALSQGQGFENIGNETLTWYGVWGPANSGVRVASWPRDRLGYYYPAREPIEGQRWTPDVGPHIISCPLESTGKPLSVEVNATGLDDDTRLVVELLDRRFQPVEGYTGDDAHPLMEDGFRLPATWGDRTTVTPPSGGMRIRLRFAGARPEDGRLYAVYVRPAE